MGDEKPIRLKSTHIKQPNKVPKHLREGYNYADATDVGIFDVCEDKEIKDNKMPKEGSY